MSFSILVTEFAETYERECGDKPSELVLRVAEHILKVGNTLQERGRKDAQAGQKAYSAEIFHALVRKAFCLGPDDEHDMVDDIADLLQSNYMEGYYNGEKGVKHDR